MRRDIRDDRHRRAHAERIVLRDGDVMSLRLVAGKPDMAAGLAGDAIAETPGDV